MKNPLFSSFAVSRLGLSNEKFFFYSIRLIVLVIFATHFAARVSADFITIATTEFSGDFSIPSINDKGEVAFVGTTLDGRGIHVGDGLTLRTLDTSQSYDQFSAGNWRVSINNSGYVAANVGLLSNSKIIRTNGSGLTTIAEASNPPVGGSSFATFGIPSLSDNGTAAFQFYHISGVPGRGIFTGSGGALTPIFVEADSAHGYIDPSLSRNGNYLSYAVNPSNQVFLLHEGATNVVLTSPFDFNGFQSFAVNNVGVAIGITSPGTGSALIMGDLDGVLFSSLDGNFFNDEISIFHEVSINDSNQFAFRATGGEFSGIYTGSSRATKVVEVGDFLDGSTVFALAFGREGINNRGDITFWARLSDGRQGIYVTSIPEPSTFIIFVFGSLGLLGTRRRTQA